MRVDADRRGRGHAERHDDHGRDARRRELGQAGDRDLLRQRPALGQPRRRQTALPEDAGVSLVARPTLARLAAHLAAGRTTSRALVEEALARIADPAGEGSRVFVKVYADRARAAADGQDLLRAAG